MSVETYKKLGQNKQESFSGDFVLKNQELGTEQGFGHVSKKWIKTGTMSYEEGLRQLEEGKEQTEDIQCRLPDMTPSVDDSGRFCMSYLDGRRFYPTEHAVNQMGTWLKTGTWFAQSLYSGKHPNDGAMLAANFSHGRTKLIEEIANSKRRQEKFIFRTRRDGSLRAMMTAAYRPIDNRWVIETIKEFIPGGLLSHWNGDSDTIYGNVLIPDTIRAKDDSDYGGMVSIGNCEIGIRRISMYPSVFRAICMNGCIWNQQSGKGIKQVHRGEIKLDVLKKQIAECIQYQIPLISEGIDKLLNTRNLVTDIDMKPVFAEYALEQKLTTTQAKCILDSYYEELKVSERAKNTLFGVVNAITRAGQCFENSTWVDFDTKAGKLLTYTENDWKALTGRAANLKLKQVEEIFTVAS